MNINWITAEDINAWAAKEPRRAQEKLPELIAKLIHTSSDKIESINFPNIQSSGYDGTLVAEEKTNYFPANKSVWELGTNEDALGKFKLDIAKRSNDPLGVDIKHTVFIFATLKIWKHRDNPIEKVVNEAKQEYNWKDIRILDAHELSRWIEVCPSVAVWFSKVIGNHIDGVISADYYWDDRGGNTDPKLTPDCLMIGREHQIERLSKWLHSPAGYMIIKAESSLESALFAVATILIMEEKQKEKLLSRIIIIENSTAWSEILERANTSSILIPMFPIGDMKCPSDICVLFPVSKYDSIGKLDERNNSVDLKKYNKLQFDELLKLLRCDSTNHANLVFDTKRSFLPLYRKITKNPTRREPRWIGRENTRKLLPAMFASGWNDNYTGDRKILEILSGMGYDEYMRTLNEWAVIEDAPILVVQHNNYVVSVHDTWKYLYSSILDDDLERIKNCLFDVFSNVDPTFELPEEQWHLADLYGKKYEYSQSLIHGLIITLIMLSERDGQDNYFDVVSTKKWVDSVVEQILKPISTWQHWNTIAPVFHLLAEASPTAVIERLEKAVNENDAEFWKMFNPSKDVLWGRNYYTHILWAMEKLVWIDENAVQAIRLLAMIGERDIEYKTGNTPLCSLYEIFCLWNPQNCLNMRERIELLEVIVLTYPKVGWKLLNRLKPEIHSSCGHIQKPRWREFNDRYSDGIPDNEHSSCVERVLDMCLQYVGSDKERWIDIIGSLHVFGNRFDVLSKRLHEACKHLNENDISELCNKLREKIYMHRKFNNAKWSASVCHVAKWELLFHAIMPDTIVVYRYLLKYNPYTLTPVPYDREKATDYEQRQLEIFNLRKTAFEKIVEKSGEEAFLKFCADAEDTMDWVKIIAEYILKHQYDFNKLSNIRGLSQRLYYGVLWAMYSQNGLDILLNAIKDEQSLKADEIGEIMCSTPLSMEVWTKLEIMDSQIADYYWENVNALRFQDADDQTMEYYIEKLLCHKRPFSAIIAITYTNYDNSQSIIKILRRFLELQEHTEKNGLSIRSIQPDEILELFEKLYNDFNIDDMDVARLEMAYMQYFYFNDKPKCLIRCITKMPELFIEFISIVCKHDNNEEETIPPESENVFRNARYVLDEFNEIPGCSANLINEDVFINWMQRANQIASESGYTKAFECYAGKLLSYSPVGNDGVFPHEIIRSYLESNSSEPLFNNFITEKRNQRGVHYATWGAEEKLIAQKYKDAASSIRIKYPKTASVLNKLSECYSDESRRGEMMEYGDFSHGY